MSVYYYEPFYNFDRLFDAITRPAHDSDNTATKALKPRMDLHEDAAKNIVTTTFELPGLRTLRLPQGVKEEEIKASLDNGLLTVTFPKASPETAPKKIAIA